MNNINKTLYLAGFLFSLPIALSSYINSSFIKIFIGEKFIGIIYAIASVISIIILFIAPKIWEKIGAYKFLILITFLEIISFAILSLSKNSFSIISTFIIMFSINSLIVFSLDELLKIISKNSATGKIRGIYLTICSLAWIIAQLAFGTILGNFDFKMIYLLNVFIMTIFFILILFNLQKIPEPNYDKINVLKYLKKFIKNKNLSLIYSINFLLNLFFCIMIIYTPIYLSSYLGFSWKEIGIIFSIMLLPFVIIPFQMGKYGDRYGERKMLILGFIILSLSVFSIFFIKNNIIFIWMIVLFMTRVGASTIEIMSDTYFFKHIKPENEEFIGVYRTASPIAYIIGPITFSVIFYFIPSFNYIYIILGTIMLLGIIISLRIKKSDI